MKKSRLKSENKNRCAYTFAVLPSVGELNESTFPQSTQVSVIMGKTGSPGREEDQHHQKLGLVSILAVGTLFLFIGYHLGGHDDHTTKRTSFAGTYAGRRGQRGPAESVGTDDKIGSAYPSSIKPVTMPDYVPDYTNENCKSIKNHPFGRACPAPLEVEATQREAAEKSLAKLPWIKVLEETPKMKTDSEGNLIVEDWNPPENFMSDWAKKAVKDALLPWNSYIDPFQIESYSVRAKGRGGCSLRIHNGKAAGCTGGGYEWKVRNPYQRSAATLEEARGNAKRFKNHHV